MRCGKMTLALCVALASCMTMAEVGSAMGPAIADSRYFADETGKPKNRS